MKAIDTPIIKLECGRETLVAQNLRYNNRRAWLRGGEAIRDVEH